jgi:hypothetical protein
MTFEVFTPNSYPNPARVYKNAVWRSWRSGEDDSDIGLIQARIWVPVKMKLAKNADGLDIGDPLLSIGCGIGAPPCCQIGPYAGLDDSGDYTVAFGSIGGRSGGPLFGPQGLIGILSRGRNDETMFVSHDKIVRFLRQVVAKEQSE